PRTALAQIHSRISSLRHILGAETIKTVPSGYSLTPSPALSRLHPLAPDAGSAEAVAGGLADRSPVC
ncbi:hypothetical protein AB4Z54_58750, partial [Streptomyces sp. MCAF7]